MSAARRRVWWWLLPHVGGWRYHDEHSPILERVAYIAWKTVGWRLNPWGKP